MRSIRLSPSALRWTTAMLLAAAASPKPLAARRAAAESGSAISFPQVSCFCPRFPDRHIRTRRCHGAGREVARKALASSMPARAPGTGGIRR